MISTHERSDIIHIMKMNRFMLIDSDSALMNFGCRAGDGDYRVSVFTLEDLPRVSIKQNEAVLFNDTVKSIDDLKIFLEEQLYKYIKV